MGIDSVGLVSLVISSFASFEWSNKLGHCNLAVDSTLSLEPQVCFVFPCTGLDCVVENISSDFIPLY